MPLNLSGPWFPPYTMRIITSFPSILCTEVIPGLMCPAGTHGFRISHLSASKSWAQLNDWTTQQWHLIGLAPSTQLWRVSSHHWLLFERCSQSSACLSWQSALLEDRGSQCRGVRDGNEWMMTAVWKPSKLCYSLPPCGPSNCSLLLISIISPEFLKKCIMAHGFLRMQKIYLWSCEFSRALNENYLPQAYLRLTYGLSWWLSG